MKTLKHLPVLLILLALSSCGKAQLHEMNLQLPAEKATAEMKLCCLDLRTGSPSAAQIAGRCNAAQADLLLIRTQGAIEGSDPAAWFTAHSAQWGHNASYAVLSNGNGLVVTASSPIFAESLALTDSDNALVVENAGMAWVLCDAGGDDLQALADEYRRGDRRLGGWVVCPSGLSDVLEEASFVDCLAAQWGRRMPAGAPVLYASAGVWVRMGTISTDPLSFVITLSDTAL